MARTDNLANFLTDVADSIRAKKSTTTPIPAETFDSEIASIPTGEVDPPIVIDNRVIAHINMNKMWGLEVIMNLKLKTEESSRVLVDWGDNTIETLPYDGEIAYEGNYEKTHGYSEYGDYTITISSTTGDKFCLGNDMNTFLQSSGDYTAKLLKKLIVGTDCDEINSGSNPEHPGLEEVYIGDTITDLSSAPIDSYVLKKLKLPSGLTNIYGIYGSGSLKVFDLPSTIQFVNVNLGMYYTNGHIAVPIVCRAVVPPTINNDILDLYMCTSEPFIYVPDESIDVYKSADVWSQFSNYIHPLSEYDE